MRNIVDCVNAFLPLLNTEYELVLGRKGVAVKMHLVFDKKDCFHLMGLQYLADRPELNRDRGKVFDEIVAGKITTEHIESSDFYEKYQRGYIFFHCWTVFWTVMKQCLSITGKQMYIL